MAAATMTKKMQEALDNWPKFNEFLRDATEQEAAAMLRHEQQGRRRTQYLLRAHSRLNKERARREREELLGAKQ